MKRRVAITPNLVAWLKPCRPENGKGRIILNWRWKFRAFQKALGEGWNPWPQDSLRASYASYDLERGKHAGETAKSMGHRNVDTLYRHYIDEIEEVSDAEVYWTLHPEKVALLAQQIMNLPSKGKTLLGTRLVSWWTNRWRFTCGRPQLRARVGVNFRMLRFSRLRLNTSKEQLTRPCQRSGIALSPLCPTC
jgi:hypothetical protein